MYIVKLKLLIYWRHLVYRHSHNTINEDRWSRVILLVNLSWLSSIMVNLYYSIISIDVIVWKSGNQKMLKSYVPHMLNGAERKLSIVVTSLVKMLFTCSIQLRKCFSQWKASKYLCYRHSSFRIVQHLWPSIF